MRNGIIIGHMTDVKYHVDYIVYREDNLNIQCCRVAYNTNNTVFFVHSNEYTIQCSFKYWAWSISYIYCNRPISLAKSCKKSKNEF